LSHTKYKQFFLFIIALLSGILIGYCTSVIAGALVFLDKQFNFQAWQEGLMVSSILIGGFCGAFISSSISTQTGPRKTMIITCGVFFFGSIATSLVINYWALVLCRFIVGLAIGAMTMLAPMYIAETANEKWRGFFVSNIQLAITIGIFLAYLSNYYFAPHENWQAMFILAIIPACLLALLLINSEESPRWLLLKGNIEQAKRVYYKLHAKYWTNINTSSEQPRKSTYQDLFKPGTLPATVFVASLFLFQNLSGIDAILYYAPHIFKSAGFSDTNAAFQITIILGFVNILSTVVSMLLVDKLGRRPLLITGTIVMTISLLLFSIIQLTAVTASSLNWISALMLFVFLIAFAMSMGPIPYIMMSELFPLPIRTLGMSIVSATAWGINALVTFLYPVITQNYSLQLFFLLSALFCFISFCVAILFCPETKGLSLEEIEHDIKKGKSIRRIGE